MILGNQSSQAPALNLDNAAEVEVIGNTVRGNIASVGGVIWLDAVRRVFFDHNTLMRNQGGGNATLTLRGCGDVTIMNSIFAFDSSSCAVDWRGEGAPTVRNNCVFGNYLTPFVGLVRADHCIYMEPGFCGLGANDPVLAADSPCRGAGTGGGNMGANDDKCMDQYSTPGSAEPDSFIHVEEMPVEVYHQRPIYPEMARASNAAGTVWVQALVKPDGTVGDARILKPSGKGVGFEEAALVAAYQNRYRPAIQSGRPVAVWVAYKVDFKPEK